MPEPLETTLPRRRHDHLTYKGNVTHSRFGWLRLTPAYSIHLVEELLENHCDQARVLDPFCGTGTTALLCATRGIECCTTDINPFLLWLAAAKSRAYRKEDLSRFVTEADRIFASGLSAPQSGWTPDIHEIEKWWDKPTLRLLDGVWQAIHDAENSLGAATIDLLKVAFCNLLIAHANVTFGHQSMSFRKPDRTPTLFDHDNSGCAELEATWKKAVGRIAGGAQASVISAPQFVRCDARDLTAALSTEAYDLVITSPPYPNRMSYIRELRPYMYWLGYLKNGRQAGEMDWEAIGGTWGCATSNLSKWSAVQSESPPIAGFAEIILRITERSATLARYVEKYFHDMAMHAMSLFRVVRGGGKIHYVVGNSKFYDVLLPVERMFADLFVAAGFRDVSVKNIRKRTSKKELFEFVVSARKPT